MKTLHAILGLTVVLALPFCTPKEDPKTETTETVVEPTPGGENTPPAQNTTIIIEKPADQPVPDNGTTVRVGKDGVVFRSKDGSRETNVGVSKDSTSFEIKRPQ